MCLDMGIVDLRRAFMVSDRKSFPKFTCAPRPLPVHLTGILARVMPHPIKRIALRVRGQV